MQKKQLTRREIADLAGELSLYIERAKTMAGTLAETYFDKYSADKKDDSLYILWEFEHNRILNDIVFDYLVRMKQLIEPYRGLAESEGQAK